MRSFILLAAAAVVLAAPAARAHGDDDHHGRGHGHGRGHDKEEYWDGNCKVERHWKHGEYEEKRKCRAPERVVVVPAPQPQPRVVYVYPPWMHREHEEVVYVPQYQPQHVVSNATYCNSERVGQVLGGVVGGALGNQIGRGNGRTAATIGGAIAGVLVGGDVGRRMDAGNQACVGQVLEVAPVNHPVQWVEGPQTYVVVPAATVMRQGTYCRPYTLEVRGPYGTQRTRGTACRRGDGVWVAA